MDTLNSQWEWWSNGGNRCGNGMKKKEYWKYTLITFWIISCCFENHAPYIFDVDFMLLLVLFIWYNFSSLFVFGLFYMDWKSDTDCFWIFKHYLKYSGQLNCECFIWDVFSNIFMIFNMWSFNDTSKGWKMQSVCNFVYNEKFPWKKGNEQKRTGK